MEIVSDDEVLRAALDFVDAFENEDDAVPVKPISRHGRQCARAPSPSKRLRHEILTLRRESEALQRHLALLKQSREPSPGVTDPITIVRSAWEALASRQRRLRQEAEGKNETLRALLIEQTRAARRLQKLVRKQCWHESSLPRIFNHHGVPGTQTLRSLTLFDHTQLLAQVHHMYDQTHSIFDAPHFVAMASEPEPVRNLATHDDPQLGRIVELIESRVYPYGYRLVSDAMWNPLTRLAVSGHVATNDKHNGSTDTSINTEFSFETDPPATPLKGVLHGKIVGRRMQHDSGSADVVVWAMTMDAAYGRQRVVTNEKLWMFIRPLGDIDSATASIVQVLVQSTRPQSTVPGPGRCSRPMTLDDYETCLRTHIDDYWTHVETLLLDKNWARDASARHAERAGCATAA